MKRIVTIIATLLLVHSAALAHDFSITVNGGQKVYFSILDENEGTAEVTYNGSWLNPLPQKFEGELVIPAKVRHDNKVYDIIGIGSKAFSGANKLTCVIMPDGIISIGDFAFEGCTALNKIVFPNNSVKMGQGVFFKCYKLKDIMLGNEWKEINLRMFMWSDSLQNIHIPAKIGNILNAESLRNLQSIEVDENNDRFSSADGILYNKSGEILYTVPRAYQGKVVVKENTKVILTGALINSTGISSIEFPESLTSISMLELSLNNNLETVIFRAAEPIMTAEKDGTQVFLLQLANGSTKIVVPKKSTKLYQKALPQEEGDYIDIGGNTKVPGPFNITKDKMPVNKNISGTNDFENL